MADCDNGRIAEVGKRKLIQPRDVKINKNNIFVADNNEINNIHIFTESGDRIRSFIILDKGTGLVYLCFDLLMMAIVSQYKYIQLMESSYIE